MAILVVAGLVVLALATFHPADPGWSVAGAGRVRNAAGPVGAFVADVLVRFLGGGAFLLVPVVVLQLLRHLFGAWGGRAAAGRWLGTFGALIAASGLLHLLWPTSPAWLGETGPGGIVGFLLGGLLVPYLGLAGSGLALAGVLVAAVALGAGRPWLEMLEAIGRAAVAGLRRAMRTLRWLRDGAVRWLRRIIRLLSGIRLPRLRIPRPRPPRMPAPPLSLPSLPSLPADGSTEPEPLVVTETVDAPGGEEGRTLEEPEETAPARKSRSVRADTTHPPVELLDRNRGSSGEPEEGLEEQARLLEQRLADFGITAEVVDFHTGPVVTRFELEPAPGTKASKVTGLARDIARSLSVQSVRVVENVPGKPVIGLEIPRAQREPVRAREILEAPAFREADSPLTLILGVDIAGQPVVTDLRAMPHLLVAGTTGSGKSVGINAMLLSLLYKATAEEVRLILVDPKMLELSVYDGIPHLLAPVVTDMSEAANAFKWCIAEMERRFQQMAHVGVRSLGTFNQRVREAAAAGQPLPGPSPDGIHDGPPLEPHPWIVVVVDELADLMMVAGKQVEESITRLAQKARAAGIHLVLATQRPSVDVLTGLIKANIPARIAFQVNQQVDSRTILDQGGAEQLLGQGDMLFFPAAYNTPRRVHGAFVDDAEVERVVSHLKTIGAPEYDETVLAEPEGDAAGGEEGGGGSSESDPLYDQAVRVVTESRRASISNVQRRLRVGYNRAARLIDAMEASGVVGPQQSNGGREVLAPPPVES